MAKTADILATSEGLTLFYMLRITGVQYVFFCGVDPTSSKYGTSAWSFDAKIPMPGMMLPDSPISQSLPDVIGGFASPERITLTVADREDTVAGGKILSKLFSPGIAIANSTVYELASDIGATATTGTPVSLRLVNGSPVPTAGNYTVGGETILFSSFSAAVNGVTTGQIGTRNQFPCAGTFPPNPTHRIVHNENNLHAGGRNILVTPAATPLTMLGRTAALYVGHMVGSGDTAVPCTEPEMMTRIVGRIKSVDYGKVGGQWAIEIESIIGDLTTAKVADGLGVARICDDQIILPVVTGSTWAFEQWTSFIISFGGPGQGVNEGYQVSMDTSGITNNNFKFYQVIQRISASLAAANSPTFSGILLGTKFVNGEERCFFSTAMTNPAFGVVGLDNVHVADLVINAQTGLMNALGFNPKDGDDQRWLFSKAPPRPAYPNTLVLELVADRPVPNVFIPMLAFDATTTATFGVRGMDGSTSQYFFTDQANGQAGVAYAQFDDGAIVTLVSASTDANGATLTTGAHHLFHDPALIPGTKYKIDDHPYYYGPKNSVSTIKQVVIAGSATDEVDPGLFISRMLASYDPSVAVDDVNYFSEGVGQGWRQILDVNAFSAMGALATPYRRLAVIDSATLLKDMLTPILKEYGTAIVWDPATAKVTMRTLRIPSAPGAHATAFTESNRTSVTDRTGQKQDPGNIRSSWTLKWGWDPVEKKFLGTEVTLADNAVASAGFDKNETIEDKTLVLSSDLDPIELLSTAIFSRSDLYRQEWKKCRRTLNRVGMTLSPGSYHQVVDNTIVNPFTGTDGITSANAIYALLTSVESNLSTGMCNIEFLISRQGASNLYRPWSPCGLVDYAAANRGYNTGTGVITMARRYSSHATNKDGWDFVVGDKVALIAWDSDSNGLPYSQVSVITAVAVDGSTITVAAGLTAIPANVEVLVVLQYYAFATATRQGSVTWQGSRVSGVIEGTAGAVNNKWG